MSLVGNIHNLWQQYLNNDLVLLFFYIHVPLNWNARMTLASISFQGIRENDKIDGLMQKRRNSIALAMELRLFCIKPSIPSFFNESQYVYEN